MVTIVADGDFLYHMSKTMIRVLIGFACSMILSLVAGVCMGIWKNVEQFMEPGVLIGLTIPALCWAAISVMLFGLSEITAVFTIVVLVTPMITVNILAGMKALDRDLTEMARAFGAGRKLIIREIVVPQLLPYLVAGMRFGLALSWKVVVIAEMMGLSNGIGYQISYSFGVFSMRDVLAWTLSFTGIMFVIEYGIIGRLEKRWSRWRVRAAL